MNIPNISANTPRFSSNYSKMPFPKRSLTKVFSINKNRINTFAQLPNEKITLSESPCQIFKYLKTESSEKLSPLESSDFIDNLSRPVGLMIRGIQQQLFPQAKVPECKWLEIPSFHNNPKDFDDNVELLKKYSHGNWNTKSYNAEINLKRGDFHIYMVGNEPTVGIRFLDDCVYEIMGVNGTIPVKFLREITEHTDGMMLSGFVIKELNNCKTQEDELKKIKKDIAPFVKDNDIQSILNHLGYSYELMSNGNIILLSDFGPLARHYDWKDLGIDINKIFEKVVQVRGDVKISDSQLNSFGQLSKIEGDLYLVGSSIKSLGNELKEVGGSLHLQSSMLEDLGGLEKVGKIARFGGSNVRNLGNLKYVGKDLILLDSKVEALGSLEFVRGSIYCNKGAFNEESLNNQGIYIGNGISEVVASQRENY